MRGAPKRDADLSGIAVCVKAFQKPGDIQASLAEGTVAGICQMYVGQRAESLVIIIGANAAFQRQRNVHAGLCPGRFYQV